MDTLRTFAPQPRFVYDRLYGRIELPDVVAKLITTPEAARLSDISLSAVPPRTLLVGVAASRLEHSLGVAHLAYLLGQREEFVDQALDITVACLAHDIGSTPFSHVSEHFLKQVTGLSHEQYASKVLLDSQFAEIALQYGANIDRVVAMIAGELPPTSDVVAGSIDLDNLDNTIRYGLSLGLLQNIEYDPRVLANSYRLGTTGICLETTLDEILKWERVRQKVYSFVYGHENLSAGSMLHYALFEAYLHEELDHKFFRMTDNDALYFLLNKSNPLTQLLVSRALRFQTYQPIFSYQTTTPSGSLGAASQTFLGRTALADELSEELGIGKGDITTTIAKMRNSRQIHLPIHTPDGIISHQPENPTSWVVHVFANPDIIDQKVVNYVTQMTSERLDLSA